MAVTVASGFKNHACSSLLDAAKAELRRFVRESKIRFRDDATNATLDAPRNRVRNELLPLLLRHYQPALPKTVLRLMEIVVRRRIWLVKPRGNGSSQNEKMNVPLAPPLLGAPASRRPRGIAAIIPQGRPVGSRKPELAGGTPALPGTVPRFRGSKREISFRRNLSPPGRERGQFLKICPLLFNAACCNCNWHSSI